MKPMNIRRMLYLMPLLIIYGCEETVPQQHHDTVSFYVQAKPQVKAVVENTDSLIKMNLPLYVTEDGTGSSFKATEVQHTSNGVWRSTMEWEDRQYNFYAYIKSAEKGELGILSIDNNGRSVTVTQPSTYSDNPKDYADYLLSYRVPADGRDKPLVQLEMERITTAVELYMTAAPNMSSVKLKKAEFKNIFRSATYNISYHATSKDPAHNGLKNTWAVNVDQSQKTSYTLNRSTEPMKLEIFDESKGRFAKEYKVMGFLTVQQSLLDNQNALLNLTYEVEENGTPVDYEVTFDLGRYDVKSWSIGHKIRYYVSVDTSVELQGSIEPWITVESIEGTFLPK